MNPALDLLPVPRLTVRARTWIALSGGMDSICLAWWKRPESAITIDYGQLAASAEIAAAAQKLEAERGRKR